MDEARFQARAAGLRTTTRMLSWWNRDNFRRVHLHTGRQLQRSALPNRMERNMLGLRGQALEVRTFLMSDMLIGAVEADRLELVIGDLRRE
jgi:hypothetical protein